jgi:hypothetical protein
MIEPGTCDQIKWDDDTWIIWDVGFGEDVKSSGLLMPHMEPKCFRFSCAKRQIVEQVKNAKTHTNLVIEAPLSVCFNKDGNPTPRVCVERVEVDGETKYRRWHQAGGIMIAAMYVIRAIADAAPNKPVRLFEGFVSYKDKEVRSDHCRDVSLLREVIKDPERFSDCIYSGESLRGNSTNTIESAFKVCRLDCGVPAVIKREMPRGRGPGPSLIRTKQSNGVEHESLATLPQKDRGRLVGGD